MPKRALTEKRPWLVASLIAAISFYFVRDQDVPGLYLMIWKGAGVALLAAYAASRHKGRDANQIALVMALGASGDVLIELALEWGAAAFLIGHLVAVQLYWNHRRQRLSGAQRATGLVLAILTPVIAYFLPAERSAAWGVAFYALTLGAMAGMAWTSSFSRYRVGIGAVLFVLSDLLIFAQMGPLAQSAIPDLLIWPLYYFGQFLICTGVVGELRKRTAAT